MAPPEMKAEHVKMIPEFSGEVALLPNFIEIADNLVEYFYNVDEPGCFQNFYIINSLKKQIKGEAKLNISSHSTTDWPELKRALLNTYGDKRDCYTLTIEICNMKQLASESAFAFHTRVQNHLNLHASYVSTHNIAGKKDVSTYLETLALRTFLKGLKEPLGSLMRTKDPKSLNEALNTLTNDFQIDANANAITSANISSFKEYKNHPQDKTNRYVPPAKRPQGTNQNRFNNSYNRFNKTNNYNNNNNNPWRPSTQQGAGPSNQNVWNKPPGQLPKPSPMSAQTTRANNLHQIDSHPTEDEDYAEDTEDLEDFQVEASEPTQT